jgi:hypothetical protein
LSPVEGERAAPPILLPPPAPLDCNYTVPQKVTLVSNLKGGREGGRDEWEVTFGSKARLLVQNRFLVQGRLHQE